MNKSLVLLVYLVCGQTLAGFQAPSLGLKFGDYDSGRLNLITDVKGVLVGQVTLNSGAGKLSIGRGPVRTGVTVVLPGSTDPWTKKVMAGSAVLNGNGEALGKLWLDESGLLESPIALTNTLSVAAVQSGLLKWNLQKHPSVDAWMPVVLECDDSSLNDINGQHVKPEHVRQAIERASESFEEGSVGAGTGMISFDFKSGIGSASRIVPITLDGKEKKFTLGVLINMNIGTDTRNVFRINGIKIAKEIPDLLPVEHQRQVKGAGSAVIIVATDAPLDSRQLSRLALRTFIGIGRLGTVGYNGSGEVAIAFSTATLFKEADKQKIFDAPTLLSNSSMNNLFEAVVEATEEAALNSLLAAKTVEGRDGNIAYQLPPQRVKGLLRKHKFVE